MSNPTAIRAEDVQKVHASVKKASDKQVPQSKSGWLATSVKIPFFLT